jgi:Uma2 family endonuclease
VRTLLPDPPPAPFDRLLKQREQWGADRWDEVWEGVLHMNPPPSHEHEQLVIRLGYLLTPYAQAVGLELTGGVGIGDQDDYRVPDLALHRPGAAPQWHPTAALVVEIVSPGDETPGKLPFYANHQIDELLIADPTEQTIRWLALDEDGLYRSVERSGLIDLDANQLARQLNWPQGQNS